MSSPYPHNLPYSSRRYAWFVVFLLIIASLVAFMNRQIGAIVVDPMQQDLGVGEATPTPSTTSFFGLIGILFLHLGRKHYALSMKNVESWDGA